MLIIILSSGLYFNYDNNLQQKSDQLAQFEEKMNQPLNLEQEVTVELNEATKQQNKNITIRSPFNSQLKLEQLQQELVNKAQEPIQEKEKSKKEVKIKRPPFKLLGVLRNNSQTLVTMVVAKEIKRLTLGEKIGGFSVVEININNVVLKKEEQQFTFWLGQKPQGAEISN